ncbi:MAG: hypothetical protein B7Z12_10720 [Caulobacter vibrioides]|uniref:Uncharacterized protein n=1 Tax=Caulobacter vibrioides TaxID=155892 RepID=A0A258D5N2_CAUVI|nr:MAG: hypothetical protein B7Z12_10720 [Caulobacter vibrioides]
MHIAGSSDLYKYLMALQQTHAAPSAADRAAADALLVGRGVRRCLGRRERPTRRGDLLGSAMAEGADQ